MVIKMTKLKLEAHDDTAFEVEFMNSEDYGKQVVIRDIENESTITMTLAEAKELREAIDEALKQSA